MVEQALYDEVLAQNRILHLKVEDLIARLDQLTRMLLEKSSERFVSNEVVADSVNAQLGLFGTVEIGKPEVVTVPEHKRPSRKGKHPGRNALPKHLPRRIELLLPEGLQAETRDDDTYHVPGYQIIDIEVSERIEYVPGSITVIETRRPKLVKLPPSKDKSSSAESSSAELLGTPSKAVLIAPLPARLLAKSIADETLVIELIIRKFCEHMPLYRQAQAFKRDYDWVVALSTLSHLVDCVAVALRPLHEELRRQVFSGNYIQMDETGLLVLAPPGPNAEGGQSKQPKPKSHKTPKGPPGKDERRHQGYMWLAHDPQTRLILFEYHKGRSHALPLLSLANYKGYLQVDGWGPYRTALSKLSVVPEGEKVGQYEGAPIVLVCCLAHIRRKFFDSLGSQPTEAKEALVQIQAMYAVEEKAKDFTPDERLAYRTVHLAPLFKAFSEWLEQISIKVIPKAGLARAIKYAVNQWPLAAPMLKDGRIRLDNNLIENEVRPQAIGRKNYLFAGSHGAAHNIAVLYSLLATCKSQGVNPREWLNATLKRLAVEKVDEPHKWLPNYKP